MSEPLGNEPPATPNADAGPSPSAPTPPPPPPAPAGSTGSERRWLEYEDVDPEGDAASAEEVQRSWERRQRHLRRLHLDSRKGRGRQVTVALLLVLGGLATAVVSDASPQYQSIDLATSGSFFALAEAGNDLYAASDNGGSILLEESTDRGLSWTASAVPLSAVAGGAPWNFAVVAGDGSDLLLAASTGSLTPGNDYGGTYACGSNSTLLLASSSDGGHDWSSVKLMALPFVITSLQGGVVGTLAAVSWLSESIDCDDHAVGAGAITSADDGGSWFPRTSLTPAAATIEGGTPLQMAAGMDGIVEAFEVEPNASSGQNLTFWEATESAPTAFSPLGTIPAPESWSLQGNPQAYVYLVTPDYLVPLDSFSSGTNYTAIPFNDLQSDAPSVGELPRVVSLASTGPSTVEVDATTSDDQGVDCWSIDLATYGVSQTCDVSDVGTLSAFDSSLPIIALLDGGGWWTAIGALGQPCYGDCSDLGGGLISGSTAAPASSAVGTSVCTAGCYSQQGLAAYAYVEGSLTAADALADLAAIVSAVGLFWLALVLLVSRPVDAPEGSYDEESTQRADDAANVYARTCRATYLKGLVAWAALWSPLALLAYLPQSGGTPLAYDILVAVGVALGMLVATAFHGNVRQRLQREYETQPRDFLQLYGDGRGGYAAELGRSVTLYAMLSWLLAVALGLVLLLVASGVFPLTASSSATSADGVGIGSGGYLLLVFLLALVVVRVLYHIQLAAACALWRSTDASHRLRTFMVGKTSLRTRLGALLFEVNPAVGVLIGIALSGSTSVSPYLFGWATLPFCFAGILLLAGGFGASTWTPRLRRVRVPAPSPFGT